MSIVAIIQALTFTLTVNHTGQRATLHYPVADHVRWIEVCVIANGTDGWSRNSCWTPRYKTEEVPIDPRTVTISAHLAVREHGYRSWFHTPVTRVRHYAPEEE